jgi:hypothetical protein
MATASAMAPFVWGEVSFDAGESTEHIVVRKEAERIAGSGEFWWCVDTPLGISVEVKAEQNGGTLPVLFSRSRKTDKQQSSQVRVWETWRSLLHPQQHGRIPGHIIVTSGHNPGKRQTRYALTCHSDVKLALGAIGFCDLAQCRSVKGGGRVDGLRGANVLIKQQPLVSRHGPASKSLHSIAFKANLVGHSFVLLEHFRVLTRAELNGVLQFKTGDDWLSLVKKLRPRP